MQKKLLGVAVAAALAAPTLALAQSSVQVYGTVHLSVNQVNFSQSTAAAGAGALGSTTKYGVTSHASNWGLRSTENLGGGLTAWFQAEFNMQMARQNGVFDGENTARNSGVGLRGGFGNIYVGTWETAWAQTFRLWDVGTIGGWGPTTSIIGRRENSCTDPSRNGTNMPSSAGGAGTGVLGSTTAAPVNISGNGCSVGAAAGTGTPYSLWRRFGYGIFWESPVWSGVQAKISVEPNSTKANWNTPALAAAATNTTARVNENPYAWSGSLTWTGMGGRARAFIANMWAHDWSVPGATDSGYTFGGGYDFGPVNLGATYEKYTYHTLANTTGTLIAPLSNDLTAKEWAIGLSAPLGPGHLGASYAKAANLGGAGAPAINDTGAKMWNLGYEWTLSKRTALGFGIARINNGAQAGFAWTGQLPQADGFSSGVVAAGVNQTNLFVSMRHSF